MSTTTRKPLLLMCAWCRSWIDQRGQKIQLPKWVNVEEHDISHGICQSCMCDQLVLGARANTQHRAKQGAEG